MAAVKCAGCGVEMSGSAEGGAKCTDCGNTYCPACMGKMQTENEQIQALKDDPHRRVLATCPSCGGDLALMDSI